MKQLAEELKAAVEAGGEHKGKILSKVPTKDWIGLTVQAVKDTISGFVRSSKEDRWIKKGWKAKVAQITRGPSDTSVPFCDTIGKLRAEYKKRVKLGGNYRIDIDPRDWVVV